MQCKKLIRCNNVREEHASYCVSHKKAHEPKKYCEVVLNGTHQCSNYARKGENKCASHGEKRAKLTIMACVVDGWARVRGDLAHPHNPKLRELLLQEWETCKAKKGITPLSEKFTWYTVRGWMGPPTQYPMLQIRLEKKDAVVPEFKDIPLKLPGKKWAAQFWAHDE